VSDNAAVVRELFESGLSGGDVAVIDRLVSPEVTFAQPGVPQGREGLGLVVELDNDAFADWRYELDDVLVDAIASPCAGPHAAATRTPTSARARPGAT
jgi:hypothetical protein